MLGLITLLLIAFTAGARPVFNIETAPCPWTDYEHSLPQGKCPKRCFCYIERNYEHKVFLKTMNCSDENLNKLPDGIPKSVNKINLSHNKISAVANKMFDNLHELIVLVRMHRCMRRQ